MWEEKAIFSAVYHVILEVLIHGSESNRLY